MIKKNKLSAKGKSTDRKGHKGKHSKGKVRIIKNKKSLKGLTSSTSTSTSNSNSISKSQKSLLQLIQSTIKNSKGVKKSQNNLASKLIQLANKNNMKNIQRTKSGSSSYSKAVQSSYTSINKNGVKQEYGQTIENESTKPYIEVSKLHNGIVNHYKLPRQ